MKILYGQNKGYTPEELKAAKPVVFANVLSQFRIVLAKCDAHSKVTEANSQVAQKILALPEDAGTTITPEIGGMIKTLWADAGVQATWKARAEYQVQDALKYYCEQIDRIMAADYVPNNQDILRARVRTSGIVEENYKIDDVSFVMFDVGGQRNERKKWIHCFEGVTAVIFVAAINEYNQVLFEDNKMNRMDEAIILFDEICNSQWFKTTAMILFLNKKDLFREKLPEAPFRIAEGPNARFQDFEGPHCVPGTPSATDGTEEFEKCYEAAATYCLKLFVNRNTQNKEIYTHITCATDTQNVKIVFNACKDIILRINLRGSGFLEM